MEYNFFNENNQPNDEKKDVQRIPASPQDDKRAFSKLAKIGRICLAGALAIVIFLGGMLTTWMMLDPEIRTLITVKKRIQNEYYKEVTDEDFYKAIFGGINDTLLDAYSGYMTPEEFAEVLSEMGGNRIGVGLTFTSQQTEPLRIARVCGNSPAEEAGIVAGEKIIACGSSETEMQPCETFEDFTSFLANYGENEEFCLRLASNSGERTVKLHKAAYVENLVFYRTSTSAYAFTGAQADVLTEKGAPLNCLDEDTAYIRLVEFTGNAANEFALAMGQFRKDGKKHLILDLRENGGGYLDIMQSIASYFCKNTTEKKPIVAVADFGTKKTVYRAPNNYYYEYFSQDSQINVLADRYSASASECLIGCMLDYGAIAYGDICLAERDGVAKTYGKGIMQETSYVNILKQDAITLTTAEIRWPVSNNSIHGRGVLPEDGALTVAENTDFEMETINAVNVLLKTVDKVTGSFTVNVNKYEMVTLGLSLSECADLSKPTSVLSAKIDQTITNVAEEDLPDNVNQIDGVHNSENYIAYTFYLFNAGTTDEVNYEWQVKMSNVFNGIDEAIRLKLYIEHINNTDLEKIDSVTTYAKTASNGSGAEPNTIPFYSTDVMAQGRVDNFSSGNVTKFTVVLWLESNDPDCVNWIECSQIKIEMSMSIIH